MKAVIVAALAAVGLSGCIAVPYHAEEAYYPAPAVGVGVGIYSTPAPYYYRPYRHHHRHHRYR